MDINRFLVTLGCVICTTLYIAAISSDQWVKSVHIDTDTSLTTDDKGENRTRATARPTTTVVATKIAPITTETKQTRDIKIRNYGIWRYCSVNGECSRIGDNANSNQGEETPKATTDEDVDQFLLRATPTWLQAVRIFSCLATLLEGFGAANGIAGLLRASYSSKESKICLFLGPLFMLLAMTIYTGYAGPTVSDGVTWGWCYTVSWFGTCFTPVYGIFAVS